MELGPGNARLTVHTGRAGAAAKAGHDLVIEVTRWSGTLDDDGAQLTADARSLRVRSGSGGISPLGDDEKAAIKQTIDEEVLKGAAIVYRSTRVERDGDRIGVSGELELCGRRRPLDFALHVGNGRLHGRAQVKQTDFGIKPYSALFGTLKVADVVEVEIESETDG